MIFKARILLVLYIIVTLALFSGCAGGTTKEQNSSGDQKNSVRAIKGLRLREKNLPPATVAKVNGDEVATKDFERRVQKTKFVLDAKGVDFKGPAKEQALEQLREQVIKEMVMEHVIIQEAEREGIASSEAQGRQAVDEIKKNFDSPDTYRKTLESRGLTEEAMVKYFQFQLTKQALANKIGDEVEFNQIVDQLLGEADVEINETIVRQILQQI